MDATHDACSMPRIGEKAPAFKAVTTQGDLAKGEVLGMVLKK